MTSLVAYEDSDAEDESLDQGGERGSLPSVKCTLDASGQEEQRQKDVASCFYGLSATPFSKTLGNKRMMLQCHSNTSLHPPKGATVVEGNRASECIPSHPHSCFDGDRRHCAGRTEADRSLREMAAPLVLPGTPAKMPIQQNPPSTSHSCNQPFSNTAKSHQMAPSTIKPYIPKRQRLATPVQIMDQKPPVENASVDQARLTQILSEVSEKVKPYLAIPQKHGRAGMPKKLLTTLGGHQGPVNTVQWCPVPHLSHLLLSASMDKTVKVWDGADSGRCLRVYSCHSGAVRDACWTPCGQRLLTCSFDNTARLVDVDTGQQIVKLDNQFKLMCVALHPTDRDVFLCGGYSSVVNAWDSRNCKVVKVYKARIQQTLDIMFLQGGAEFVTSTDSVSRDSADRTLIAWDYQTTAKVSNQIYHERYTCPSLALHPVEESFVAQTNGNYMAVFSSQRPYKMNKRRQYEGHKVEGFAVQCEFSLDGSVLASGSSTGSAHFYDYQSAHTLHTLRAHSQPCLCVSQHPVLPSTAATCDWGGEIKIWH
ncbi:WD repeat-containing protein 25 isoform X1 [Lampris incognitus]|uniref:WD repeat-containing protein 25 isoform X1 n=1 Tax=Lampris incognitus TaxID=2546036 RepID=UPI0024B4989A|nr:WD repeat-containing protein 25 isoform X1 [Lampris incognitus]